jgi:hypothetical protein
LEKSSYVDVGKKLRLIRISINPAGTMSFSVGAFRRKATDFMLHVELGGIARVVAPIIGRQPSGFHIWLKDGKPPAFIREEGALYESGPVRGMKQFSPTLR